MIVGVGKSEDRAAGTVTIVLVESDRLVDVTDDCLLVVDTEGEANTDSVVEVSEVTVELSEVLVGKYIV